MEISNTNDHLTTNKEDDRWRSIFELTRRALDDYANAIGTGDRRDFAEHAERSVQILRCHDNNMVHPASYVGLYMHDLAARIEPLCDNTKPDTRSVMAVKSILEVITNPQVNPEEADYIVSSLADTNRVEKASGQHRIMMADYVPENSPRIDVNVVEMLGRRYQGSIPKHVWDTIRPVIDLAFLQEFSYNVNVENMFAKSAELIDNMTHPVSQRDSARLQDYMEAMSFYGPLLDIMTFDTLAATLYSRAHKLNLIGQGKWLTEGEQPEVGSLQYEAMLHSERMRAITMERVIGYVFGVDNDKVASVSLASSSTEGGEPPMQMAEFAVLKNNGEVIAGNSRYKMEGTWALKKDRQGFIPPDEIGMMVISDDIRSSANDFVDFIEEQNSRLVFQIHESSKKTAPIYIQGSRNYVVAVEQEIRRRGLNDLPRHVNVQSKKDSKKAGFRQYEVSKVYIAANELDDYGELLHIEVQFLTKDERKRSQTGAVSHVLYKYLKQFKDRLSNKQIRSIVRDFEAYAADINDRASHVSPDSLEVNERSIGYRDDFYGLLESYLPHLS